MESTLSKQISELLEPHASLPQPHQFKQTSPMKCWHGSNIVGWDNGSRHGEWYWIPVKWDTDEAACARLLDVMGPLMLIRRSTGTWVCDIGYGRNPTAEDRKTAICLAFVAWFSGLSSEAQDQLRKEISK